MSGRATVCFVPSAADGYTAARARLVSAGTSSALGMHNGAREQAAQQDLCARTSGTRCMHLTRAAQPPMHARTRDCELPPTPDSCAARLGPAQGGDRGAALAERTPQGGAAAGEQVQRVSMVPRGGGAQIRVWGADCLSRQGAAVHLATRDLATRDSGVPAACLLHAGGAHRPAMLMHARGALHRCASVCRRPSNPAATIWISKLQDEADLYTRKVRAHWRGMEAREACA